MLIPLVGIIMFAIVGKGKKKEKKEHKGISMS
jgi:hypothetical protein